MSELHIVALSLFLGLGTLAGSIFFLAVKLRSLFEVTVSTPPVTVNQAPITVQAPQALLPEALMETLQAINEKLSTEQRPMDGDQLKDLIEEGVTLAESSTEHKGVDKFKIAKNYVIDMARGRNLTIEDRSVALGIEAEVAFRRLAKK